MKYIVIEMTRDDLKRELPFIFPNSVIHLEMATVAKVLLEDSADKLKIIAAGDYNVLTSSCSGKSTTLDIKSRGDVDTDLINSYDYFHGIVN